MVEDDGSWYPIMDSHSLEQELGSIGHYERLLTGCEDGHIQKPINDHKHTIIFVLGG